MKHAIILTSETALPLAEKIKQELPDSVIYSKAKISGEYVKIHHIGRWIKDIFSTCESIIFIGAMGICVRTIAPYIRDKHTDPAIINIDSTGKYVISVLSGHIGGANELTKRIARIIGAEAVITTQSDNTDLWAFDILGNKYDWILKPKTTEKSDSLKLVAKDIQCPGKPDTTNINHAITTFVNKKPTALLLDISDRGTQYLEQTKPGHVDIFYKFEDIDCSKYKLLIAVTPFVYPEVKIDIIYYHPKVLHLGIGCRKNCSPEGITEYICNFLQKEHIATAAIKDISTIELKKEEPLLTELQTDFGNIPVHIYTANELNDIQVTNPSEKVKEVTSVYGVSEAAAIRSAGYHTFTIHKQETSLSAEPTPLIASKPLLIEKQKAALSEGNDFTFAVAIDKDAVRRGHIEIVGAGPGDPELISVAGKRLLEEADLILYAGSLVPIELTYYAKQGAVVRSSASMNLEEQFALMKEFYDKGKRVVRLHTGDPCIYGAIQEQMAFFDKYDMSYHITPGISSFQAAAAALNSQFTIPEKVQTIILTRGEGRTPMPEKEKLHLLARSQSTMCIYLSAAIVDEIQKELLVHYPPETPVAACYKLTWKDERIYRGQLKDLADIVKKNNLTLTTLLVVGEAIDNRRGLSRLYADEFKHLFRQ